VTDRDAFRELRPAGMGKFAPGRAQVSLPGPADAGEVLDRVRARRGLR
jgi:hypothetical protein